MNDDLERLELPEPVAQVTNLNGQPIGVPYYRDGAYTLRHGQKLYSDSQIRALLAARQRVDAANTSAERVQKSQEIEHGRERAAEPVGVNETAVDERQAGLSRVDDRQQAAEPAFWIIEGGESLYTSREVAALYCEGDDQPIALYTRAAPAEVTEAMVERAIPKLRELSRHATWSAGYHRVVKEALEAALGGGDGH